MVTIHSAIKNTVKYFSCKFLTPLIRNDFEALTILNYQPEDIVRIDESTDLDFGDIVKPNDTNEDSHMYANANNNCLSTSNVLPSIVENDLLE